MMHLGHIFLIALLAASVSGHAQTNALGAMNIPHNKQFKWNHVSTESFDVNYYTDDPVMAGVVGKMAEEALWDISKTLDYKNLARFSLYLFVDFNDLVHSNSYPRPNFKENGVTPLRMNYANLVFPGSYDELFSQVRSEVIRLLMEDYYFGGPIQLSIQSNLLLYLPEWYAEGFPSYMGEGWDYEDEMWLSSLEKSPLLTYAVDGQGMINRTLRKSIWYYIAQKYGPEKLGEIFYMTRLTRSVEDGIIHVLGITLKTLTENWREFVLQRITENASFREPINKESIQANFGSKSEVLSFALNPVQPKAAVYLNHEGKQRVLVYNFQNGKFQETPIAGGSRTEQFSNFRFEMPMAWSPDGIQLVTTVYDKSDEYLAWYDMKKESVKFVRFHQDLDRILQIAWHPSGNKLVCSGLRMGQIDLFEFAPLTGSFTQLTHDFQDDLFPVWSDDGERIYHASTRTMVEQKGTPLRFDANAGGFDIWAYSPRDESLSQVTRSPSLNEFPVAMYSGFELLIRSDQTGIYNLQKVNAFLGDSTVLTNMTPGMFRAALSDSLLAYSMAEKGILTVNVAPRASVLQEQVATRTILRQRKDKAAALEKVKKENF
jgi:Tol biopolymer transport system component